jgi:hypothetical protein
MATGTGVELHPCTKDGMIPFAKSNTNLSMHARKKTTIFHFSSARSSESKSTHKIHPILFNISVTLNGKGIKRQPRHAAGSEGTMLALTHSGTGSAGIVSRTMGNRCGAAGVSENGVDGCWSRSGVVDDMDVASGVAGGVARGVKFSVKRLAGGRETRSTGSIAKGFSDDVRVVWVTAGHALACEGVGGIVSLELGIGPGCRLKAPVIRLTLNYNAVITPKFGQLQIGKNRRLTPN